MNAFDTLTTLFRHHRWANVRLFELCADLTDEQLDATIVGTFGSIRDTLRHIAAAEKSYFSRISTGQSYQRPTDAPPPTVAQLLESVSVTGSELVTWAGRVQASDMVVVDWDGAPRAVPKTIILTQVINHATEHRAQIMATLTHLGIEPPSLDGWTFFDESSEDAA